eukprot:gene45423-biopygen36662
MGDPPMLFRRQTDPGGSLERCRDHLPERHRNGLAGDPPDHLADQPAMRDRMIGIAGARLPQRPLRREQSGDSRPVEDVVEPQILARRRQSGLVVEHLPHADVVLAGRRKLRPVRRDRRVVVQPASLDLRLSDRAWRVRASFLPGKRLVSERIADVEMHPIDMTNGVVLEKGCVYVIPLMESLALPAGLSAVANAKSSTGRLDLLTRTITDGGAEFDRIPEAYKGPLYAEVCPRSFSVLVRAGQRLNQIRFRYGHAVLSDDQLRTLHAQDPLVSGTPVISEGLGFSVDLRPTQGDLLGYRAKPHTGVVDLDRIAHYPAQEFWEEVRATNGQIILDPGAFYIL